MDDLKTALLESQSQLADQQKRNEELMEKETEIEHMRNQIDELEVHYLMESHLKLFNSGVFLAL